MYGLFFLLVLLLDGTPNENLIIKDTSDFVEINHVYRTDDKKQQEKRMIQIIWWEWKYPILMPEKNIVGQNTGNWYNGGTFVVKDYRIMWANNRESRSITPRLHRRKWICLFYDDGDRCIRQITSRWVIITHTMYDREVVNREILENSLRNRLTKPDRDVRMRRISQEIEDLIDP